MNNIVIEIPSTKKEVLRVAALLHGQHNRPVWIRRFNIIQITSIIMRAGYLQVSIPNRHRAHALTTEPHSIV